VFTFAVFGLAIYAVYDIVRNKWQDYSKKKRG
jgi:hypothetical protein